MAKKTGITIRNTKERSTITVVEEATIRQAPLLKEKALKALDADNDLVVVEHVEIEEADVAYLQTLVALLKSATEKGKTVSIVENGSQELRRATEEAGIETLRSVFTNGGNDNG